VSHPIRAKAVRTDQNLTAKRLKALGIAHSDEGYRIIFWRFDKDHNGEEQAVIWDIWQMPDLGYLLYSFNHARKEAGRCMTIEAVQPDTTVYGRMGQQNRS
jgi:hypothetical protein